MMGLLREGSHFQIWNKNKIVYIMIVKISSLNIFLIYENIENTLCVYYNWFGIYIQV